MHTIWHALYCRWYDHDRAGHPRRAAAYGWLADKWCHAVWPA